MTIITSQDEALSHERLAQLTPTDIRAMNYNDLIALVRETNRIPGGRRTVHLIASRLMLTRESKVLEIGCATGSTTIELARLTGCKISAIDLNPTSIAEAKRRATLLGVDIDVKVADALAVPEPDASFDALICGNVTALINDKAKAVREYDRLLKEGGMLIAVPMYYVTQPSNDLVNKVRRAIQVDIPIHDREQALELYLNLGFEVYDILDFAFDDIPLERVKNVSRDILAREHLSGLMPQTRETLEDVYMEYMELFRNNLALMGYSVMLLRKTAFVEDPELFTARPVGG